VSKHSRNSNPEEYQMVHEDNENSIFILIKVSTPPINTNFKKSYRLIIMYDIKHDHLKKMVEHSTI